MKTKSKLKELRRNAPKYANTPTEVRTPTEFTHWLALYRSRVYETYFAVLTQGLP